MASDFYFNSENVCYQIILYESASSSVMEKNLLEMIYLSWGIQCNVLQSCFGLNNLLYMLWISVLYYHWTDMIYETSAYMGQRKDS